MKKILLFMFVYYAVNALAVTNSIVAVVNDEIITFKEISEEIEQLATKEQRLELLDKKINLALQLQKIKEVGLVPKDEILQEVLSNVAYENNLSLAQLQALPKFNEIRDNIIKQVSLQGLAKFVLQNVEIQLTQQEIDAAIAADSNYSEVMDEQIRIAQIAISSIEKDGIIEKSNDKLMKQFLLDLSDKIKGGSSFSSLAKLHSQESSYKNGGESAWLSVTQLPLIFRQKIKNLKQEELSEPFKTEQGSWHIIKIIDSKNVNLSLENIKYKIIELKQNIYFSDWMKQLRDEAYIEIFADKID